MWATIRHFIRGLSPYAALSLLAIPTIAVELLKVAAVFFLGEGHWTTGLVVMLCAYAVSLFITERLFEIIKPKLMTIPWFRQIWSFLVLALRKMSEYLRAKWRKHATF